MNSSKKICFNEIISPKRLSYDKGGYFIKEASNNTYSKIRTPFHRDYDRIIFSQAFRKMSNKTQVHPLDENDIIHNRLTHSLETASVGRSLGLIVGSYILDDKRFKYGCSSEEDKETEKDKKQDDMSPHDIATIVQVACLAHDLGNPPFGHAGEYAIGKWFEDFFENEKDFKLEMEDKYKEEFKKFNGNAQGFRLITRLENNFNSGGMELTISSLAASIKYPNFADDKNKNKFSIFYSEKNLAELIFSELSLTNSNNCFIWHPLSFLMEAADDICYVFLDMVDAVELKLITINDVLDFYKKAIKDDNRISLILNSQLNDTRKISKLTAYAINELTLTAANVFINNIDRFFDKSEIILIPDIISLDKGLKKLLGEIKKFSQEIIFTGKSKQLIEISAYEILGGLLENFVKAVLKEEKKQNYKDKLLLKLMGIYKPNSFSSDYEKLRSVVDFISGMIDRYALSLYRKIMGIEYKFIK